MKQTPINTLVTHTYNVQVFDPSNSPFNGNQGRCGRGNAPANAGRELAPTLTQRCFVHEFAQQLATVIDSLPQRAHEPALIAVFGLALILGARVISRISSFLAVRETEHLPEVRSESIVEIRLGEVNSSSWQMSTSACSQTPPVGVSSSNVVY